jgi:plasmid stabilization system protein, relE/parE family
MKKYPYIVFYKVNDTEKQIIIKGIFNTYQDTSKYPE